MYNLEYHVYVPTLEQIKNLTGIDLVVEEGDKNKAEAKVLSLSLKAKNYLLQKKLQETKKTLEYLIAFNDDYQKAFLQYVVAYIESYFYSEEDYVFGNAKVPYAVDDMIYGSILKVERFTQDIVYEVENSDLEW